MVYLGIVIFLVGLWQSFMRGKYSPVISSVLLVLGTILVFIGNWQLGLFFIFFFASWWFLMQMFRFSICENYFLKTIPILIAYAFLISFFLNQFSFPYALSGYACLIGVLLWINDVKQYKYKDFFKNLRSEEHTSELQSH